jgi:hypothetical protein
MCRIAVIAAALSLVGLPQANAAEIKVLTAGASAKDKDAALALIKSLDGPAAAAVLKSKGMEAAS